MAQSGSASALGAEGRRFESCLPDHFLLLIGALYLVAFQSLNFLIGFFFNQLRRSVGGSFNILRFGFERGGFIFSYHLFGGFSRAFFAWLFNTGRQHQCRKQ